MEALDSMGIQLFVLAARKEHQLYLSLFFGLFMLCSASASASASALQIVVNNSSCGWAGIAQSV